MIQKNILELEFKTDSGLGHWAKIGIIVLQTDQTLEHEFRNLLNFEGVTLYHSRIPNEMKIFSTSEEKVPTSKEKFPTGKRNSQRKPKKFPPCAS